jgi:DNA-binding GntR family transcriptional regulator
MTVTMGIAGPPARATLADQAYAAIRDHLITLKIPPGSVIDEEALMRTLKMGRTPIRDAIKRLALEKLVVIYPRRGTLATHVDITDLARISEVRIPLEGLAACCAARRASSQDIGTLELVLSRLPGASDNRRLLEIDVALHRAIYRSAHNPHLEATLTQYLNLTLRILYLVLDSLPNLPGHLLEQRELVDAMKARDADRAHALAVQHLSDFVEEMRTLL